MFTQNWLAPQVASSVPHSSMSVERAKVRSVTLQDLQRNEGRTVRSGLACDRECGSNRKLAANSEVILQLD